MAHDRNELILHAFYFFLRLRLAGAKAGVVINERRGGKYPDDVEADQPLRRAPPLGSEIRRRDSYDQLPILLIDSPMPLERKLRAAFLSRIQCRVEEVPVTCVTLSLVGVRDLHPHTGKSVGKSHLPLF